MAPTMGGMPRRAPASTLAAPTVISQRNDSRAAWASRCTAFSTAGLANGKTLTDIIEASMMLTNESRPARGANADADAGQEGACGSSPRDRR